MRSIPYLRSVLCAAFIVLPLHLGCSDGPGEGLTPELESEYEQAIQEQESLAAEEEAIQGGKAPAETPAEEEKAEPEEAEEKKE